MKAQSFRKLNKDELYVKIQGLKKDISNLYFEINTGKSKKRAQYKQMRKDTARAETVLNELLFLEKVKAKIKNKPKPMVKA